MTTQPDLHAPPEPRLHSSWAVKSALTGTDGWVPVFFLNDQIPLHTVLSRRTPAVLLAGHCPGDVNDWDCEPDQAISLGSGDGLRLN